MKYVFIGIVLAVLFRIIVNILLHHKYEKELWSLIDEFNEIASKLDKVLDQNIDIPEFVYRDFPEFREQEDLKTIKDIRIRLVKLGFYIWETEEVYELEYLEEEEEYKTFIELFSKVKSYALRNGESIIREDVIRKKENEFDLMVIK